MITDTGIRFIADELLKMFKHFEPGKNTLNNPGGNFFYDPWTIMPAYKNSPLEDFLDQLGPIGEARVNVLKPSESYCAHADIDDRYHLTLQAEQSYLIDLRDQEMYKLEVDNKVFLMDTSRIHTASNFGFKNRIQLVVRKLLNKVTLFSPVYVTLEATEAPYNLRYLFDHSFSILLNTLNKEKLITDFKHDGRVCSFAIEESAMDRLQGCIKNCGFNVNAEFRK